MKHFFLFLITGYQALLSPLLKQLLGVPRMCHQTPTCSAYAKQAINDKGVGKGILLSAIRILTCTPYAQKGVIA